MITSAARIRRIRRLVATGTIMGFLGAWVAVAGVGTGAATTTATESTEDDGLDSVVGPLVDASVAAAKAAAGGGDAAATTDDESTTDAVLDAVVGPLVDASGAAVKRAAESLAEGETRQS